MKELNEFLRISFTIGESFEVTIATIFTTILIFIFTAILLSAIKRVISKRMEEQDKVSFYSIFTYVRYFIFLIIFLTVLSNNGVKLTALFTSAAVILLGVGLALQTLFQDIITGVFILFDKTLRVNDTIEIDGKVGRVLQISLRTTKAVTIEQKVFIIPNHFFLSNSLYNWTQNGIITREFIHVGVAYGSDVQLVKKLLLQAASNIPTILKSPKPTVLFNDFGDSSLNFKLIVSVRDSFRAMHPKSDLHFEIDRLFRENNVVIPFPQRDLHLYNKK